MSRLGGLYHRYTWREAAQETKALNGAELCGHSPAAIGRDLYAQPAEPGFSDGQNIKASAISPATALVVIPFPSM